MKYTVEMTIYTDVASIPVTNQLHSDRNAQLYIYIYISTEI